MKACQPFPNLLSLTLFTVSAIIHFNIGIAYSYIGDEDEAVRIVVISTGTTSIPYDSSLPLYTILHNIGHSQLKTGDYTGALASF